MVERNADEGVTWVHSYVSDDRTKTFCVYDAPTPEAIRKAAARNRLPVERITQVRVLDPDFDAFASDEKAWLTKTAADPAGRGGS